MILTELLDNGTRIRHYSDQNLMIEQIETGTLYEDAVDYVPCKYTYKETQKQIEREEFA